MVVTIHKIYHNQSFNLKGNEEEIKGALLARMPMLQTLADKDLGFLLRYLDHQQAYSVRVDGTPEEVQKVFPTHVPQLEDTDKQDVTQPSSEDGVDGTDELPHGLKEMWVFPKDRE